MSYTYPIFTHLVAALSLILGVATTSEATAGANSLHAGLAEIDITPEDPIRLAGYGSRTEESEDVAQKIWAKALAISGADAKQPRVLITVENCAFSASIAEKVAVRLQRRTGLPRKRLSLCATHTHTGPVLKGVLPFHFGNPLPPPQQKRIDDYTVRFTDALTEVAIKAIRQLEPARLSWAKGEVHFARNRRMIKNGQWAGFGVNPDGPVHHALPVLAIRNPDGRLKGILLSYACHATTFGGSFNQVHGDWPGSAQAILESRHPETVVMAAVGCAGDQNPHPRGGSPSEMLEHTHDHGTAIADEVDRLLKGSMKVLSKAPACRFEWIELPYTEIPPREVWKKRAEAGGRLGFYAEHVLEKLDQGDSLPTSLSYPIQTWRFGNDLAMVFLAGEVVVDYALRLERECDASRLWVNAYANAVPCYIPSKRIIPEGGYEVESSMHSYGRPAPLARETEDQIIKTVKRLMPEDFVEGEPK